MRKFVEVHASGEAVWVSVTCECTETIDLHTVQAAHDFRPSTKYTLDRYQIRCTPCGCGFCCCCLCSGSLTPLRDKLINLSHRVQLGPGGPVNMLFRRVRTRERKVLDVSVSGGMKRDG